MTVEHILQRIEARAEEFGREGHLSATVIERELGRLVAELRAELREEHEREYRHCAADACSWICQHPRLFCKFHWRALPEALRRRILTTQVGGEASPEFTEALQAAVDAIAAAEGRREQPEVGLYPDFQSEVMR